MERNKGQLKLSLLRTLKFDGTSQDIPVTNLYADAHYKQTSGDDSDTYNRFDWIAIKDDDEGNDSTKVIQILAVLELQD